jgi:small subunit ribosomal protein S3Ae
MAKGKNKKLGRKGRNKKGDKHAFLKKEWHKLISPTDLKGTKMVGWTCVNKTQGTKISTDYLKGRVGEITVTDISNNGVRNDLSRKIRIFVEEVKDGSCYTSFYGYDTARETIDHMIQKRKSLIDIYTDVRTTDNYIFRIFLTSFSQRAREQLRINSYCKSSTIRLLRKKTVQWLQNQVKTMTAEQFSNSVVDQELQKNLRGVMRKVYPNLYTLVRKVKLIRKGESDRKNFLKAAIAKTTQNQAEVEENPEAKNALSE